MIYTGIGSRKTPIEICAVMTDLAIDFGNLGYLLRSGGAKRADDAFESGALAVQGEMEIYIPWRNFGTTKNGLHYGHRIVTTRKLQNTLDLLHEMRLHPKSEIYRSDLDIPAAALHGRNMMQILGEDLDTPADFVVFYAEEQNGVVSGGTSTAVKLARKLEIPTFNLYKQNGMKQLESFLLKQTMFGF